MAWATADFARIGEAYEVELVRGQPALFHLRPRGEGLARYLERLEVSFAPGERYVERVTVRERGGDYTEMTFTGVKLNAPLPEGLFQVER